MKKEYQALKVTERGQELIDATREMFSRIHEAIENGTSPSRVRSIALTKLEEASHFAIRAVAETNEVK